MGKKAMKRATQWVQHVVFAVFFIAAGVGSFALWLGVKGGPDFEHRIVKEYSFLRYGGNGHVILRKHSDGSSKVVINADVLDYFVVKGKLIALRRPEVIQDSAGKYDVSLSLRYECVEIDLTTHEISIISCEKNYNK